MDSSALFVLVVVILITISTVLLALFVSLRMLKIHLSRGEFFKVALLWLIFIGAASAIGYYGGVLSPVVGLVSLVGGAYVLHWILNRYKKTSFKRVIETYLLVLLFSVIFSAVTAMLVVANYVQRYQISSDSMVPALHEGQNVLVHKYEKSYKVGDIIIYQGLKSQVVGRITATPGNNATLKYGLVEKGDQWIYSSNYQLSNSELLVGSDSQKYQFETVVERNKVIGIVK